LLVINSITLTNLQPAAILALCRRRRNFRIKTCFARYGYQFNRGIPKKGKSGADWEIDSISELIEILN
jgi:hypothetical protein